VSTQLASREVFFDRIKHKGGVQGAGRRDAEKARQRVHILVNNAATSTSRRSRISPEEQWERMLSLMLTAPFLLTRYVLAGDEEAALGRIVNIGSIHALIASPYKVAS
jgi:3-hydroxybutyrate dehydrogenase